LQRKGYVLIYNIAGIPAHLTMKDITETLRKNKICYYDSSLIPEGDTPKILDLGGNKNKYLSKIKFVDLNKNA